MLMSVLAQKEEEVGRNVHRGSLIHFHHRLAHLRYDAILLIANDSASRIALTDEVRANYLAYAQGKQTKNRQSRKGTGTNSPIDVIGGVICSYPKGPMTPRERLGIKCKVNYINHAPTAA